MDKLDQETVKRLKAELNANLGMGEDSTLLDQIIDLLALPDEDFELLSPGVLQSFQQTLNAPNEKLSLVQALNAQGARAEDLMATLDEVLDEADKLTLTVMKRDFLKLIITSIANAINDTDGIAKRIVPVAIEFCTPGAYTPKYAHTTDSGLDVYALEDFTVHPGETKLIPTGIKVALPVGFEFQVRAKSGRALKTKLRLGNAIGTIDQGYRGEIQIIVENIETPIKDITIDEEGKVTSILYGSDFTIGKGEAFCQLILSEVPKVTWVPVEKIGELEETPRGEGGFGSTGLEYE